MILGLSGPLRIGAQEPLRYRAQVDLEVGDIDGPVTLVYVRSDDLRTHRADTVFLDAARVTVPAEYADGVEAALESSGRAVIQRFGLSAFREAMSVPRSIPAADGLLVTDDAQVWWREPNFGGGPDCWHVVDGEGRSAAVVEVPHGYDLLVKHGEDLWAHRTDDLFVSHVARMRLVPVHSQTG